MKYVVVDIEADGPVPGPYSMLQLGAVVVEGEKIIAEFKADLNPISELFVPEALAVSGIVRGEVCLEDAQLTMASFNDFVTQLKGTDRQIMLVTDTPIFDGMFLAYYFHTFVGSNPFGHSSLALSSFWKGHEKSLFVNMRGLRKTKHTHTAIDDARGNAEAFIEMMKDVKRGK